MPIQLRPGQIPTEGYLNWDNQTRMHTCLICGKEVKSHLLLYKGYCFCQDHLPEGFERWDGDEYEVDFHPIYDASIPSWWKHTKQGLEIISLLDKSRQVIDDMRLTDRYHSRVDFDVNAHLADLENFLKKIKT